MRIESKLSLSNTGNSDVKLTYMIISDIISR